MEDFNIFDQSIIYEILFLFNSNNCQVDYLRTFLSIKVWYIVQRCTWTLDIAPFTNIHHNIPIFSI